MPVGFSCRLARGRARHITGPLSRSRKTYPHGNKISSLPRNFALMEALRIDPGSEIVAPALEWQGAVLPAVTRSQMLDSLGRQQSLKVAASPDLSRNCIG